MTDASRTSEENFSRSTDREALQEAVIRDLQQRYEKLRKQHDDLLEIALMMARRLR